MAAIRRTALLTLALGLAVGCADTDTTGADVVQQAQEAAQAAQRFLAQQIEAYRQKMATALEGLEPRMAALQARAGQLSTKARAELAVLLDRLDQQRAALAQRVKEASATSKEAWGDVEKGLDAAWQELDAALEQAAARFTTETPAPAQPAAPPPQDG